MTDMPRFQPSDGWPQLKYLSLGWGVQSWTLAAMIALRLLPPIDVAIHSDTGHENSGTYDHARRWTPWLEERGLKVLTVRPANDRGLRLDWGKAGAIMMPAFTLGLDDGGSKGQLNRQCTSEWKIRPIRRAIRDMLGRGRQPRPGAVECWQGISLDEFDRMRTSDVQYIVNAYPLVDMRMTRQDCIDWLHEMNLPVPPKSACVFCPYHDAEQWRRLRAGGGWDWHHAVDVDTQIRHRRDKFDLFVHRARVPLEEAVKLPDDAWEAEDAPCDGGVCMH